MKQIKVEIIMDVEDYFIDEAKRWEHHVENLLDLESNPEMVKVYDVKVTENNN